MSPDTLPRVVSLEAGVAMVVTDLHGDWDAYARYRDRFLTLQARCQADYLIFTGDLIHNDGLPQDDRSLDIMLDVLRLKETQGERLIYLLGNHELPHLYGITLQKGSHLYTPSFEAALGERRGAVMSLFDGLPFYVRTRAGVSICHAGAAAEMSDTDAAMRIFNHSHRRVLDEIAATVPIDQRPALRRAIDKLNDESYDEMARRYLAVSGPDDPRYDDLLIGLFTDQQADFELLWAAFFTRNEQQYGERNYDIFLDDLLRHLSAGFHEQTVMVTGHLACRDGYTLVGKRQLRLASGSHAHPRSSGRCLLFDVEKPLERDELLNGLESVM